MYNPHVKLNYEIFTYKPRFDSLNENFLRYHSNDESEFLPDALNIKLSNGHGKLDLPLVN